MPATAELELTLRTARDGAYAADVRLTRPDAPAPAELATGVPVRIDHQALVAAWNDPASYGQYLSTMLFADERLRSAWTEARALTSSAGQFLRIRLRLDLDADALHELRWEILHDPTTRSFLTMSERFLFSRYLDSAELTPTQPPERPALRALVVIASPSDLDTYSLLPIDVEGETARARAALGDMNVTLLGQPLSGSPQSRRASLTALRDALREGPHILYLICHGRAHDGETRLWLEQENGLSDIISGEALFHTIQQLAQRPLLAVFAVCQSGSGGREGAALAGLGPRLARAGIPAVIAMQGNISVQSTRVFLPTLFRELRRDGQIDRALAVARVTLSDRPDWWMPILFLRGSDGQIWRDPHIPERHHHPTTGAVHRPHVELPGAPSGGTSSASITPIALPFDQAGAGLQALAELMPRLLPEVRDAIAIYQTNFEAYRHQIVLLNDYKHLHDELQQIDEKYELLVNLCRRLQGDDDATIWRVVEELESNLHLRLEELLRYVRKTTFFDETTIWTTPLDTIRVSIRAARQRYDADQFSKAINLLKPIVAEQLGATDTSLKEAAKALRLSTLASSLDKIHTQLQRAAGANPERVIQQQLDELHRGVDALKTLDEQLSRSITLHTQFQRFDNKLRLMAAMLSRSVAEMSDSWPIVQQMMNVIGQGPPVEGFLQLRELGLALDPAIALNDERRIRPLFNDYRSLARQIFNQVDVRLLDLCEKLKQIGEPLDGVLRMMRPPTGA